MKYNTDFILGTFLLSPPSTFIFTKFITLLILSLAFSMSLGTLRISNNKIFKAFLSLEDL